ncbi:hypothetical protein ABT282_31090 [Streptomyces sp. NPDC000927]|uniref:hypothetical protein n=1 Tax=Streptomyces sp. NPDC000927 TaxID=3154371 RepID=UPI003328F5E8
MAAPVDPLAPYSKLSKDPLPLSQSGPHQQGTLMDGSLYLTQVIDGGKKLSGETEEVPAERRIARGDIAITRLDETGTITGVMYCLGFDHGQSLSSLDGYLYLACHADEVPDGKIAYGRRVARVKFTDGAVLRVDSPGVEVFTPAPDAPHLSVAVDTKDRTVGVSYLLLDQHRYITWTVEDFLAGDYSSPVYDVTLLPTAQMQGVQSWALREQYAYLYFGEPKTPETPDSFLGVVIIDLTTGNVTRVAAQEGVEPGLPWRAPGMIEIFESPDGPGMVFGLVTPQKTPQKAVILFTVAGSGPGFFIGASPLQGSGISIVASIPERGRVQSWSIVQLAGLHVLWTGGPEAIPDDGLMELLDSAPPPCQLSGYGLEVVYEDGEVIRTASPVIEYIPESGCGRTSGLSEAPDVLGCASRYTARIHERGGGREFVVPLMDELVDVSWSRTINDVSTASVTLSRAAHGQSCCLEIRDVHPWMHELTIYRDGTDLVWQGPVHRVRYRRDSVVIEAQDVFGWVERLANTYRVGYTAKKADKEGRRTGTIAYIAKNHLRLNLSDTSMAAKDYPRILDYMVVREDGLPVVKVEKDGSDDKAIWAAYMGDIFREWSKRGLTWTTIGRTLLLRGFPSQKTIPIARLDMSHLIGDVEVIRDGSQATTHAFATTQDQQDVSKGKTLRFGHNGTAYGRLDTIVEIQEEKPRDLDLLNAAKREVAGRYPAPVVVQLPSNAQLSTEAPLTMRKLVPGERVDLYGDDLCLDMAQGFAISDVEVTWSGDQEKVGISLVPLDDFREETVKK